VSVVGVVIVGAVALIKTALGSWVSSNERKVEV